MTKEELKRRYSSLSEEKLNAIIRTWEVAQRLARENNVQVFFEYQRYENGEGIYCTSCSPSALHTFANAILKNTDILYGWRPNCLKLYCK